MSNNSQKAPWVLPRGWVWQSLGDICRVSIGGTPKRKNLAYWKGDNIWVSIADLNGGIVTDSKEKITDEGVLNSNVKEVLAGTVLMSFKLTIGKMGIAGKKLYTNEAITALPIKDKWQARLERDYLFYALQGIPLSGDADFAVKGNTLNKKKLAKITIPIPHPDTPKKSLETQRRIVARIQELMAEVKKTRTILKRQFDNTRLLIDSALEEKYNKAAMTKWPNKLPLKKLVKILPGQVDPTADSFKKLPHIGGDSIESGTCMLLDYQTAEEDGVTSGKYLFNPGVVLYSKIRPYLRKAVLVDFKGLCSADVYPLTITSEVLHPRFLMWSLIAPPFAKYANICSNRARMPKINRTDLFSYEFPFPDKKVQEGITEYLDLIQSQMDTARSKLKKQEVIISQLEQSILEKAFRGELV